MSLFLGEMGKLTMVAQVLKIGSRSSHVKSSNSLTRKGLDNTNADEMLYNSPSGVASYNHQGIRPKIWLRLTRDMRLYYTDKCPMNTSFSGRLQRLLRSAKHAQYLLACLSTLGGANHLCNKPRQALALAKQQESVGHKLGSTDIVLRARAFQAVNYALLGAEPLAHALFADTVQRAIDTHRESTLAFVQGLWDWLQRDLEVLHTQQREERAKAEMGGKRRRLGRSHKTNTSTSSASAGEPGRGQVSTDMDMGMGMGMDVGKFICEIEVESPLSTLLYYNYKPPVSVEVLQLELEVEV